jgi:hypothetical protein
MHVESPHKAMESDDESDLKPRGIADLVKQGEDAEIFELDKSGNIQRHWLHRSGNAATIVSLASLTSRTILYKIADGWALKRRK